jgi:hypothetical protein
MVCAAAGLDLRCGGSITTEQARRAYFTWLRPKEPPQASANLRSVDARAREQQLAWIVSPTATAQHRRELRDALRQAHDALPGQAVSDETMAASVIDVFADKQGRIRHTHNQPERQLSRGFSDAFRWAGLVIDHADLLAPDRPELREFWE